MYRRFGSEVFRQNPLVGTVKMGWSHSYYNTETWEEILRYRIDFNTIQELQVTIRQSGLTECSVCILFREKLGNRVLIKTAGDELSPKVRTLQFVELIL